MRLILLPCGFYVILGALNFYLICIYRMKIHVIRMYTNKHVEGDCIYQ